MPEDSEGGKRDLLARLAGAAGLCADCRHRELLSSPRSVFLRCAKSRQDARFPRYPPLPVLACAGYEPQGGA